MRSERESAVMSEQSTASGADDAQEDAPATPGTGDDAQKPPSLTDSGDGSADARVVGLDSTDAEAVLDAVASDTARSVLEALHGDPSTASGLADHVNCSLQTVQYHLNNLADADLVAVVGTRSSEKGREMNIYGPVDQPVVVYAGDGEDGDDLRSVLTRLVSGVAFLGLLGLLVQELFGRGPDPVTPGTRDTTVSYTGDAAGSAAAADGVAPGLVFFAGGLVVLVAYLGLWYLRRRDALDAVVPSA